jgi:hypothetical protein
LTSILRERFCSGCMQQSTGMTPTRWRWHPYAHFFDRSIRLRLDVLATGLNTRQQIYDLRRYEAFFEIVVDEIVKESPEVQRRIFEQLKHLNREFGMSCVPEQSMTGAEASRLYPTRDLVKESTLE